MTFQVNDQFRSFESLTNKTLLYEKERFVKLWVRNSRSIETAKRRVKRYLSDDIRYYELTYSCIHGGKQFKPRGKGEIQTS